jgi:hypothetical protein
MPSSLTSNILYIAEESQRDLYRPERVVNSVGICVLLLFLIDELRNKTHVKHDSC